MKQFFSVVSTSVAMTFRNFMGVYVILAPAMMLVVLRLFLPSVASTSATVAIVENGPMAVQQDVIVELERFAEVERYDSLEAVENRLRASGSAEGLYFDPDSNQYVSLMERNVQENELFSNGARAVRQAVAATLPGAGNDLIRFSASVPPELSDWSVNSPLATAGGAIFYSFFAMIAGFLIGMSIVQDKEQGTIDAIRVSPVTRSEYYLGKAVFPILTMFAYVPVGIAVLRLVGVSIAQTFALVAASVSLALLFGLVVGAIARNETEALGIVKGMGTLFMLALAGGLLLPDRWEWIVYWVPVYWIMDAAQGIFQLTATWTDVLWRSGVLIGICLLFFLGARPRLARGLA